MNKMGTSKIVAAAALAAGIFVSSAVSAAPAASTQGLAQQAASNSNVQNVRDWRRGGGWRGRHHHGGGWGWGAAAATGLLLGGALAADAYDDDGYYDDGYRYSYAADGVARCEATFRSFDPGSGTYMGYDGVRHTCPYL